MTLLNSSMFERLWSTWDFSHMPIVTIGYLILTEFIKHVFPRFFSPSLFLGLALFSSFDCWTELIQAKFRSSRYIGANIFCCVRGWYMTGRIITLFSFLETFRRAGEGVVTEAESGRFLLALRDLSVRTRWTIFISKMWFMPRYSSLFWFEVNHSFLFLPRCSYILVWIVPSWAWTLFGLC